MDWKVSKTVFGATKYSSRRFQSSNDVKNVIYVKIEEEVWDRACHCLKVLCYTVYLSAFWINWPVPSREEEEKHDHEETSSYLYHITRAIYITEIYIILSLLANSAVSHMHCTRQSFINVCLHCTVYLIRKRSHILVYSKKGLLLSLPRCRIILKQPRTLPTWVTHHHYIC